MGDGGSAVFFAALITGTAAPRPSSGTVREKFREKIREKIREINC
jgi:hypothetical protein